MKLFQSLFLIGVVFIFTPLYFHIGTLPLRGSYFFFAFCLFILILSKTPIYSERSFLYFFLFILYGVLSDALQNGFNSSLLISLVKIPILFVIYQASRFGNYLRPLTISILILIALVILFHWSQGFYTYYKLIGEAKVLFGLAPLLLYGIKSSSILWYLLFSISFIFLLISGERKVMTAFVLSFIKFSYKNILSIAFFSIPVILLSFYFFDSSLKTAANTYFNIDSVLSSSELTISNKYRLAQFLYSFELFLANPIFGSGLNASVELFSEDAIQSNFGGGGLHNTYLAILLNGGLIASIIHIIWLVSLYRLVKERSNSSDIALRMMKFSLIQLIIIILHLI